MLGSKPPLISRLRRRLASLTWLLAFVLVAKAAVASSCVGDGLVAADDRVSVSSASLVADTAADGDAASCWHAGNGGCHCSCVHAAGLPVLAAGQPEFGLKAANVFTASSAPPQGVPSLSLRPPIA